jgi:hypothetical protein
VRIKIKKKGEEKKEEEKRVVINGEGLATPARSVASLDSIVASADFIEFE